MPFARSFRIVAAVHASLLAVLLGMSACSRLTQRHAELRIPVDFVVEPPPSKTRTAPQPEPVEIARPDPKPEVKPDPKPEVKPDPEPEAKPEVKPDVAVLPQPEKRRKVIERSNRVVTRNAAQPPQPRPRPLPDGKGRLTEEEVRELLRKGARLGDHTTIPDADTQDFERVRAALYRAWVQPTAEEVGDAVTAIALRLGPDGQVQSVNLVSPSGNAVMDGSVLRAARSVRRIAGLGDDFVRRHGVIEVAFKLE